MTKITGIDIVRFRSWFSKLFTTYVDEKILRCKAVLRVEDGPNYQYTTVIQGVGGHVEMDMLSEEDKKKEQQDIKQQVQNGGGSSANKSKMEVQKTAVISRLVVIFQHPVADPEKIRAGFQKCRVSVVKAERASKTPAEKFLAAAF